MIGRVGAAAVLALACAWCILRFAWQPYRCTAAISELTANTLAAEKISSRYDQLVRARLNVQRLELLRESCPTEVRVPVMIGANQELAGLPREAVRSYEQALFIEQRPEIYVSIANVHLELGDVEGAVRNYVHAARFSPSVARRIRSRALRDRVEEELARLQSSSQK